MNAYYSGLLFSSLLNCLSLFRERGVLWPIALNFKKFHYQYRHDKKEASELRRYEGGLNWLLGLRIVGTFLYPLN